MHKEGNLGNKTGIVRAEYNSPAEGVIENIRTSRQTSGVGGGRRQGLTVLPHRTWEAAVCSPVPGREDAVPWRRTLEGPWGAAEVHLVAGVVAGPVLAPGGHRGPGELTVWYEK